jgi:hypothetical protein
MEAHQGAVGQGRPSPRKAVNKESRHQGKPSPRKAITSESRHQGKSSKKGFKKLSEKF